MSENLQHVKQLFLDKLKTRLKDPGLQPGNKAVITRFMEDVEKDYITIVDLMSLLENINSSKVDTALLSPQNKRNVELLIALGADVNAKNAFLETPLMIAARSGLPEVIEILLNHGAQLEAQDRDGYTALIRESLLNRWKTVELLQGLGARANVKTKDGRTPLMLAAGIKDEMLINRLVLLEPDPEFLNMTDDVGETALMYSVRRGNVQAIMALSEMGADLEMKNKEGDTALMLAVKTRAWSVVKVLVARGAGLDTYDSYGCTPGMLLAMVDDKAAIESVQMSAHERKFLQEQYQQQMQFAPIVKNAGHILGFTRTIAGVESTGLDDHKGYSLLKNCVDTSFLQSEITNYLVRHALELAIECLEENDTTQLMENYEAGKPTILPIGWPGHECTLVAWNDLLFVCNRGDAGLKHKISVFKIPGSNEQLGKMPEEFLQTMIPENQSLSSEQFLITLRELVGDLNNPMLAFESQDQKHGNCAFVNVKASLQPMLCFNTLLKLKMKNSLEAPVFNSTFLEPLVNKGQPVDSDLITAMRESKNIYKAFTKEIRDQQVSELCKNFESYRVGSEKRKLYLEIFEAILSEHYGQTFIEKSFHNRRRRRQPKKINEEKDRALKILFSMRPEEKTELLAKILPIAMIFDVEEFGWWVKQGADVNMKNEDGCTALMIACSRADMNDIKILHSLGADLEAENNNGDTALVYAIKSQNLDAVKVLLALGVEITQGHGLIARTLLDTLISEEQDDFSREKLKQIKNVMDAALILAIRNPQDTTDVQRDAPPIVRAYNASVELANPLSSLKPTESPEARSEKNVAPIKFDGNKP